MGRRSSRWIWPLRGLLRLGAVLPSDRSYSAEIEDELAAFALEAGDDDELAGHLRTALAFVIRCFKREGLEEN
jgi:hypothetical protein